MDDDDRPTHLPKIDVRKLRAPKEGKRAIPCYKELNVYLACIKGDSVYDSVHCKQAELTLHQCVEGLKATRVTQSKHKSTLTFHLQRFARQLGYRL